MSAEPHAGAVFVGADELARRVEELGREITRDYAGADLILVALLKASFVFLADLSRAIALPHALEFVEVARYAAGSRGVRLLKDLGLDVADRDVLLVENVVDTGLTLNYLRNLLALRRPRSLAIATLLDRPYRRLVDDLPVRYVGFVAPDEFFVGYGFDLDQRARNLPDLRVVADV